MPPVVVAAGITAAGALGGAALAARGANKATEATSKATADALTFAKQQDTYNRAQYENAMRVWDQSRRTLLGRYGIDLPALTMPANIGSGTYTGTSPYVGAAPTSTAVAVPREGVRESTSLADILARRGGLGSAFDWEEKGLSPRSA